jgi:hypothetical protein
MGVYCKLITPYIIAGIEANINEAYAIHQVSLNVYFTCKFPSRILSSKVALSFRIYKKHSLCILNFMPNLTCLKVIYHNYRSILLLLLLLFDTTTQ